MASDRSAIQFAAKFWEIWRLRWFVEVQKMVSPTDRLTDHHVRTRYGIEELCWRKALHCMPRIAIPLPNCAYLRYSDAERRSGTARVGGSGLNRFRMWHGLPISAVPS